jgi:hypothetical protein
MISALSIVAVFTIVVFLTGCAFGVFLGGAAFGMLTLFIISIHRTSRAPLSDIHGEHAGSVSRHVLTGGRVTREESSE